MNRAAYRKLLDSMRQAATDMDAMGKAQRSSGKVTYKAGEYFEAAIILRNAADKLEYALA